MKSRLVTCIYNGLNRTKIGGRLNRDRPYSYSLGAISKTGAPISCYTSPQELSELRQNFLNEYSATNIDFYEWDLYSMYFHQDEQNIRIKYPEKYMIPRQWADRCVEIMWGKFLFIKDTIKKYPDLDHVYWIDAGLSHPGIIHSRFNPNYEHNIGFVRDLDKSTYHLTFRNELIFHEKFMDNLTRYTGNESILNILCNNPQHTLIPGINYKVKGSVIGGIFGGRVDLIDKYCDSVIELFEKYIKEETLYTEEHLMTIIASDGNFPLKYFKFDTWYHPDWEERYNGKISFCDFFDEIEKT